MLQWPLETVGVRSNSPKKIYEKAPSNSNCTRKPVLGASKPKFQNMAYTNHQYMTKIFQFLQMKLGITASCSTFSMAAYKTNVLLWGVFMSSSMKAAIHLGPNYLMYKNTNFEEIESLFNINQKLIMDKGWKFHLHPGRDQYYLMIKRSNVERQKCVCVCPFHVCDR